MACGDGRREDNGKIAASQMNKNNSDGDGDTVAQVGLTNSMLYSML